MLRVMQEECEALATNANVCWEAYEGKAIVVTGATGIIGQTLVGTLLAHERVAPSGMTVCALVRNVEKAHALLGTDEALSVVAWDATAPQDGLEQLVDVDYIFHCANMTDSAAFVNQPVEVIETTVGGAKAMLDLAQRTQACLCLLSTMETYGEMSTDAPVREDQGGFLDAMVVRNSYPEAKRLDEVLCASYVKEYGTNAKVARLTQTFGPGVNPKDGRVFAYFARCALAGEDIVMLTDGTKRNSYLYTFDAASALLYIAARGTAGRAYNVANDRTFCEVREMAQLVAERFGNGKTAVRFEIDEKAAARFRKGSVLRLNTAALESLGWHAEVDLDGMYEKMMAHWHESGLAC